MVYLDSWVWLEYGLQGERWTAAQDAIDAATSEGGAASTIALTGIDDSLAREIDRPTADLVTSAIEEIDAIVH